MNDETVSNEARATRSEEESQLRLIVHRFSFIVSLDALLIAILALSVLAWLALVLR
jgi:hypothetical protein